MQMFLIQPCAKSEGASFEVLLLLEFGIERTSRHFVLFLPTLLIANDYLLTILMNTVELYHESIGQ